MTRQQGILKQCSTIIRQFYGPDGTPLTCYNLPCGHTNTMPTKLFNRKFKTDKLLKTGLLRPQTFKTL